MTSKEFIMWLKGFTEGVHEYNVTPKQWDLLKEKLAEVNDEPIRTSGYAQRIDFTTGSGTTAVFPFPGTTITYTTSSGSAWSYTNSTDKNLLHD
jgi:hypothetical protein